MTTIIIWKQKQLIKNKHEHILRIFANNYKHNPPSKNENANSIKD